MMSLLERVNLNKEIAKENHFEYWTKKFETIADKIGRNQRVSDRELASIDRFEDWRINQLTK
jgi:hypothetical protein